MTNTLKTVTSPEGVRFQVMSRRTLGQLVGALALTLGGPMHAAAAQADAAEELDAVAPVPEFPLGRPANAILVAEGDCKAFRDVFRAVLKGFESLGLTNPPASPASAASPEAPSLARLWSDAVARSESETASVAERAERLRFLPDGLFDCGFDPRRAVDVRRAVSERIADPGAVDLIFVLGELPARELLPVAGGIPMVVLSSDDLEAGFGAEHENLHVARVTGRFARQTEVFHEVRPFGHLALLASEARLASAGEDEIREACERLGVRFETVTYPERGDGSRGDFDAFMRGLERVRDAGCDAVVLPWFFAEDDDFPTVVDFLVRNGIVAFSQAGGDFVARGILLGAGTESIEGYGLFEADVVERILSGETPSSIRQTFTQRGRLVVNLVTAMRMGWRPPFGLLVSVERAYAAQSR